MIHTNTSGSRSRFSQCRRLGKLAGNRAQMLRVGTGILATSEFKGYVPAWEYWRETDSEGPVSAW